LAISWTTLSALELMNLGAASLRLASSLASIGEDQRSKFSPLQDELLCVAVTIFVLSSDKIKSSDGPNGGIHADRTCAGVFACGDARSCDVQSR
jgi:hypothetical protein